MLLSTLIIYSTLNWNHAFYLKVSLIYRIFIILSQQFSYCFYSGTPLCFTQGLLIDGFCSLPGDVLKLETNDDIFFFKKKSHIAYVWISSRYTYLISSTVLFAHSRGFQISHGFISLLEPFANNSSASLC